MVRNVVKQVSEDSFMEAREENSKRERALLINLLADKII